MVQDTMELVTAWSDWTRAAGMTGSSVREGGSTADVQFCSSDSNYHLKRDGSWWLIDESDERGNCYPATATFSTIQLAEKYLIWTWGSLARTAVGAEQLGRRFQQQGLNDEVGHGATVRANFIELTTPDGVALCRTQNP